MSIKPLTNHVVVNTAKQETSAGGIVLTDAEKPNSGEVVCCGPGIMNKDGSHLPMSVKTGDRVVFGQYAGTETTIKGEKYLVMREDDIVCVIE